MKIVSWFLLLATTLAPAASTQYTLLTNEATLCPNGREIQTKSQCLEAGYDMGGSLQNGVVKEGDSNEWPFTPCGCFLWGTQRVVHWKPDGITCTGDQFGNHGVVCQADPAAAEAQAPIRITGTASQSSTCNGAGADRANDGDVEGGRNGEPLASVAQTCGRDNDPSVVQDWWRLDFDSKAIIETVRVYNREDCCPERLDGAVVNILDEAGNVLANKTISIAQELEPNLNELSFGSVAGAHALEVTLLIDDSNNKIQLAEVVVMGYPDDTTDAPAVSPPITPSPPTGSPHTEPTPPAYFGLTGPIDTSDESPSLGVSITDGSGCTIQYSEFPWYVSCELGLAIEMGIDRLNNGGPVEIRTTAGVTIDVADITDPSAQFMYATEFGPLFVDIGPTNVGDEDGFTLNEFDLLLNKETLTDGLCLSNLPDDITDLFPIVVPVVQESVALVGGDVCASAPGLLFSASGLGGEVRLLMEVSLFDPAVATSATAIEMLDLDEPIVISLDVGERVAKTVFGTSLSKRRLADGEANPIGQDGTFRFGESAFDGGSSAGTWKIGLSFLSVAFAMVAVAM